MRRIKISLILILLLSLLPLNVFSEELNNEYLRVKIGNSRSISDQITLESEDGFNIYANYDLGREIEQISEDSIVLSINCFGEIDISNKNNPKSLFEKLLVQELIRDINGKDESFLAIRNIVLKENLRHQGLLTVFLSELEKLNVNIMFHDVVNNKLLNFLEKREYLHLFEVKSEHPINSLYKMKKD